MLWIAGACLLAALGTIIAAPMLLTLGRWTLHHPRWALGLWYGAFFAGAALVAASLLTTVLGALAAARTTVPDDPAGEAILVTVLAWLGLGACGATVAYIAASAEPLSLSQERALHRLAPVASSRENRGAFTLVRFDSPEPVACAVPGRHPEILLSSAMEELLPSRQLEAVLAHEFAHLRRRHGAAVRIAELNAMCVPRLRASRALRRATLLLVELDADDAAARQAGPAHLANALSTLSAATGDEGMLLRAARLSARRWPRPHRRRLPEAVRVPRSV